MTTTPTDHAEGVTMSVDELHDLLADIHTATMADTLDREYIADLIADARKQVEDLQEEANTLSTEHNEAVADADGYYAHAASARDLLLPLYEAAGDALGRFHPDVYRVECFLEQPSKI